MSERAFPAATLETERLLLRPFGPGDANDLHVGWNDPAYLEYAPVWIPAEGSTLDSAVRWCAVGAEEWRRTGRAVSFAAQERAGGAFAGQVALFDTDWTRMITEIHYWTMPAMRGRGYAPEAARAVATWALAEHGFARVVLHADVRNAASGRVADAAGFRFEGVLRNASLTHAGRGDLASYSLIPGDLS